MEKLICDWWDNLIKSNQKLIWIIDNAAYEQIFN